MKLTLLSAGFAAATAASLPSDWKLVDSSVDSVTLSFGVKMANPGLLKAAFDRHTAPGANEPHYSLERLTALIGDEARCDAVVDLLQDAGATNIDRTATHTWVTATFPEAEAEKLLAADFARYQHETGLQVVRTLEHELPARLAYLVDMVSATYLPTPKRDVLLGDTVEGDVTPGYLRQYYNVDIDTASSNSSISLLGAIGQAYDPADITAFDEANGIDETEITLVGKNTPKLCSISLNSCGEATLDISQAQGIATGATTYFWSIASSDQDPFLTWLTDMADAEEVPLVASGSYGADEGAMVEGGMSDDMTRFDQELQSVALRGTSVIISSGDDGAPGSALRTDTSVCDGAFAPSWPATSPYVTAVGATAVSSETDDEVVCSSDVGGIITSGGGFSVFYDAPDYQADAVKAYLDSADLPDSSKYNAAGRAYPDVALQGYNYEITVGGKQVAVSGTSASAPVFASMITLINSERLAAGKESLGFLNTQLYSLDSSVFNDVTSGNNACAASNTAAAANCCEKGFDAAAGWDAATGLGSVDFAALHAALL